MGTLGFNEYIYVLPSRSEDKAILYAPLHRMAVIISSKTGQKISTFLSGNKEKMSQEEQDEVINFFNKLKVLDLPEKWEARIAKGADEKSRVTLSLTNACNLRCIYCYAKTGIDTTTMSFKVAKDAIDEKVRHALRHQNKNFYVKFHGGGEAFVKFKLLKKCVEYVISQAKLYGLQPRIRIVTNATLITRAIAMWLKENNIFITASIDGNKEVQDRQRPMASGKGSFDRAIKGIKLLQEFGIEFELRATVTEFSSPKMAEFVAFSHDEIYRGASGSIHFEPLSICGRAQEGDLNPVKIEDFVCNYIQAYELGKKLNIEIKCSFDAFDHIKFRHCGTSECTMFCITPNGTVSACSRVIKNSDDGSELFFYGQHNESTGLFDLDEVIVGRVAEHGQLPASECLTCFARWNCQGHCPVARYTDESYTLYGCVLVKSLLEYRLQNL